jgi:hypothetical protein
MDQLAPGRKDPGKLNMAQLSPPSNIPPFLAQVNVSISVGRLTAEIALIKRRSDYSKNSSLRRASDAQMYINAPNISALLQWCRAVGLCHSVQVCSVAYHKRILKSTLNSPADCPCKIAHRFFFSRAMAVNIK